MRKSRQDLLFNFSSPQNAADTDSIYAMTREAKMVVFLYFFNFSVRILIFSRSINNVFVSVPRCIIGLRDIVTISALNQAYQVVRPPWAKECSLPRQSKNLYYTCASGCKYIRQQTVKLPVIKSNHARGTKPRRVGFLAL